MILYEETYFTLTVNVSPSGGGTVTPAGGSYLAGSVVGLEAFAAEGYVFSHWVGAVSDTGSNPTSITMNGDLEVTAVFAEVPPETCNLTVTICPDSSAGSVTPSNGPYPCGSELSLHATPNAGFTFHHWEWEGEVTTCSDNPMPWTMDGDAYVTAVFMPVCSPPPPPVTGTITVSVVKTDSGNVGGLTVDGYGPMNFHMATYPSGVVVVTGLLGGTYSVDCADAGYTSDGPKSVTLPNDHSSGSASITLTAPPAPPLPPPTTSSLSGLVLEMGTGRLLAGATVTVLGDGGTLFGVAVSDSGGGFGFADVPAGNYAISASLEGYGAASTSVAVVAGTAATAYVELAPVVIVELPPEPPASPPELPKDGG